MALVPTRIGFGGAPVRSADRMGGPSERRKKTSLLMADRFKTLSKSVDLSPCVLFDVITHALARTKNIHAGLLSFIPARNAFTIAVSSGLPSQQEPKIGRFGLISC